MGEQNDVLLDSKWFRGLVIAALLSGTGGGIGTLTKTDDRFRGADFTREIAVRDSEISELKRRLGIKDRRIISLEVWRREHAKHSATWTQVIKADDGKLEDLEEEFRGHLRNHEH